MYTAKQRGDADDHQQNKAVRLSLRQYVKARIFSYHVPEAAGSESGQVALASNHHAPGPVQILFLPPLLNAQQSIIRSQEVPRVRALG